MQCLKPTDDVSQLSKSERTKRIEQLIIMKKLVFFEFGNRRKLDYAVAKYI
jgi:hypothetical protein